MIVSRPSRPPSQHLNTKPPHSKLEDEIQEEKRPYRRTSGISKALMARRRKIASSPSSTDRRPTHNSFSTMIVWLYSIQSKTPASSLHAIPVGNESGIPWTFPLVLVSGRLISACASIYITPRSAPWRSRVARDGDAVVAAQDKDLQVRLSGEGMGSLPERVREGTDGTERFRAAVPEVARYSLAGA